MTDVHKASKILFKNVLKILIDVYNAKLSSPFKAGLSTQI